MDPFCPDCHLVHEDPEDVVECAVCGSLAEDWEPLFGPGWEFAGWVNQDTGVRIFLREIVDIQRVLV